MAGTSNTNNTGVMHAVWAYGGKTLCGTRRAIMATVVEKFRADSHQCKRCARKLAEMDERAAQKKQAEAEHLAKALTAHPGMFNDAIRGE